MDNLEQALKVRNQIAAFLNVDGVRRRAPGAPRVAIGVTPGFKIAIRAPSQKELDRALGEGAAKEVSEMADYELDIQITGELFAEPPQVTTTGFTPLAIGASVGHYGATAGTLGFFAQRLSDSAIGFVSNNHVIANCDDGKSGDAVLHPAPLDHGDPSKDAVAELVSGYPRLQKNGTIVDAAFAVLREGVDYDLSSIGPSMRLQPLLAPLYQQRRVAKLGRSSGLTYGRITALALLNLDVDYPLLNTSITFDRQIEIKAESDGVPFSKPGDSGSLVVNPEGQPIGLLFASNRDGSYSYANPIADVLRELDIRMLT
jgi:hypothetical protein